MSMNQRKNSCGCLVLALVSCLAVSPVGHARLRHVHVGDTMPPFSLTGAGGTTFNYDHRRARALGVVVLQPKQSNLQRVLADIATVVETLRASGGEAFDCIGVMSGPGGKEFLDARDPEAKGSFPVLLDPGFEFWGKLGIIAAPTAVVVGPDHKVQWIKAGYSFDFVPSLRVEMAKALGLESNADAVVRVETLENTSRRARHERQIRMARALAAKGRLELAVRQLQKVHAAEPNAVEITLEFGELLCRAGKSEAALNLVAHANAETREDRARVLLILACANRQTGDLDAAESLLSKALELDPESARLLYEMGKVYQARGDLEEAVAFYRRALAKIFGETKQPGSSQD